MVSACNGLDIGLDFGSDRARGGLFRVAGGDVRVHAVASFPRWGRGERQPGNAKLAMNSGSLTEFQPDPKAAIAYQELYERRPRLGAYAEADARRA